MPGSFDQILATSRRYFAPKLADNIYTGIPTLQRLEEKGLKLIDGGTSIVQPLEYAEGNFQWFSGSETISTTDVDQYCAAEYAWKQCTAPVVISRIDELKNMGDAQVVDFVKSKMKSAKKTLKENMADAVYNAGSVANQIVGLRAIVDAGSSVGGLSQTSFSWWAAQEDTTTTTLGLVALEALKMAATEGSESPNVHYTTKTLFSKYWGLLQPQQRFSDSKSANAGFDNLLFDGKPVIADSHCPASHWFMINEEYLHLYVHKSENMVMSEFQEPVNQHVKIAHIFWAGALGSSNNRYHAKFDGLTA